MKKTITCRGIKTLATFAFLLCFAKAQATNYLVADKANLQTKMGIAMPGDTVTVANGNYNWGMIDITNNNGSPTSAWIVLRAASFNAVTFKDSTWLKFKGVHLLIDGFRFANGNCGTNPVIQFRNNGNAAASYCRITNITIDSYNPASTATGNNWVSLYGTNNRVDHCTFYNKTNKSPVVSIIYDNNVIPQKSTPTYHLIDSNYFNHIAYLGSNEGEVIRLGTSSNISTDGFNVVEYNLFENGIQNDPEIISNKSCNNTYRYNTFRNTAGGITLRRGRRCNVYSNFFIRESSSTTARQYGIRIFENGHRVFNNYMEGLNYSAESINKFASIDINNGDSPLSDTNSTNTTIAGSHFPASDCIVAFNTIVNASGGHGLTMGYTNDGDYTYQPTNVAISYNLVKMIAGAAVYMPVTNTSLTYTSVGNMYQAPGGLAPAGIVPTGFSAQTLTFNTTRLYGMLVPPTLAANQANRNDSVNHITTYNKLVNNKDITGLTRGTMYDVGCLELTSSGSVINQPLTHCQVGAGAPNCAGMRATSAAPIASQSDNGIKIYPNPATTFVTIDLPAIKNVEQVNLINLIGQIAPVTISKNGHIIIALNKITNGVNYIQVITKDKITTNYPFVVSK